MVNTLNSVVHKIGSKYKNEISKILIMDVEGSHISNDEYLMYSPYKSLQV